MNKSRALELLLFACALFSLGSKSFGEDGHTGSFSATGKADVQWYNADGSLGVAEHWGLAVHVYRTNWMIVPRAEGGDLTNMKGIEKVSLLSPNLYVDFNPPPPNYQPKPGSRGLTNIKLFAVINRRPVFDVPTLPTMASWAALVPKETGSKDFGVTFRSALRTEFGKFLDQGCVIRASVVKRLGAESVEFAVLLQTNSISTDVAPVEFADALGALDPSRVAARFQIVSTQTIDGRDFPKSVRYIRFRIKTTGNRDRPFEATTTPMVTLNFTIDSVKEPCETNLDFEPSGLISVTDRRFDYKYPSVQFGYAITNHWSLPEESPLFQQAVHEQLNEKGVKL